MRTFHSSTHARGRLRAFLVVTVLLLSITTIAAPFSPVYATNPTAMQNASVNNQASNVAGSNTNTKTTSAWYAGTVVIAVEWIAGAGVGCTGAGDTNGDSYTTIFNAGISANTAYISESVGAGGTLHQSISGIAAFYANITGSGSVTFYVNFSGTTTVSSMSVISFQSASYFRVETFAIDTPRDTTSTSYVPYTIWTGTLNTTEMAFSFAFDCPDSGGTFGDDKLAGETGWYLGNYPGGWVNAPGNTGGFVPTPATANIFSLGYQLKTTNGAHHATGLGFVVVFNTQAATATLSAGNAPSYPTLPSSWSTTNLTATVNVPVVFSLATNIGNGVTSIRYYSLNSTGLSYYDTTVTIWALTYTVVGTYYEWAVVTYAGGYSTVTSNNLTINVGSGGGGVTVGTLTLSVNPAHIVTLSGGHAYTTYSLTYTKSAAGVTDTWYYFGDPQTTSFHAFDAGGNSLYTPYQFDWNQTNDDPSYPFPPNRAYYGYAEINDSGTIVRSNTVVVELDVDICAALGLTGLRGLGCSINLGTTGSATTTWEGAWLLWLVILLVLFIGTLIVGRSGMAAAIGAIIGAMVAGVFCWLLWADMAGALIISIIISVCAAVFAMRAGSQTPQSGAFQG